MKPIGMWEKSRSRQFPSTGKLQIEELVNSSRVTVFFIDDKQSVRPGEIGTAEYVIDYAKKIGCRLFDYELETQFRCAGSAEFVDWLENTLEIERNGSIQWNPNGKFEFEIVDSPHLLEKIVRGRLETGNSARLMAGFCWDWSDPLQDGSLVEDVEIDDFRRPWNAKPGAGRQERESQEHLSGRMIRAASIKSDVYTPRRVLSSITPASLWVQIWSTVRVRDG